MVSVQDDVTDIRDALVTAQSIKRTQLHCVRLGYVSSPNVWIDFVQDDVTDIGDALVTAQRINEDSVTWC